MRGRRAISEGSALTRPCDRKLASGGVPRGASRRVQVRPPELLVRRGPFHTPLRCSVLARQRLLALSVLAQKHGLRVLAGDHQLRVPDAFPLLRKSARINSEATQGELSLADRSCRSAEMRRGPSQPLRQRRHSASSGARDRLRGFRIGHLRVARVPKCPHVGARNARGGSGARCAVAQAAQRLATKLRPVLSHFACRAAPPAQPVPRCGLSGPTLHGQPAATQIAEEMKDLSPSSSLHGQVLEDVT